MGCCGKKPRIPKISKDQQKIIDKVKQINYGGYKGGKIRVTVNTRKCMNCNTLVSNKQICPICGHKL